jgi:hypothetical protein
MIDMHMADNQGLDVTDSKLDGLPRVVETDSLIPLEKTAVDKDAVLRGQAQLMAGSGYALQGAVVENLRVQLVQNVTSATSLPDHEIPAPPKHLNLVLDADKIGCCAYADQAKPTAYLPQRAQRSQRTPFNTFTFFLGARCVLGGSIGLGSITQSGFKA